MKRLVTAVLLASWAHSAISEPLEKHNVSVGKLYKEYQDNPARATSKYKGGIMVISGKALYVQSNHNEAGSYILAMQAGQGRFLMAGFDNQSEDKLGALSMGSSFKIVCFNAGTGNIEGVNMPLLTLCSFPE